METVAQTPETFKTIPLNRGLVAKVDAVDFEWLNQWTWTACQKTRSGKFYVMHSIWLPEQRNKMVSMARMILGLTDPKIKADHKNGDTLDNRRDNLRATTNQQNSQNSVKKRKHIRYKGVYPVTSKNKNNKFRSYIYVDGRTICVGCFKTEIDAARAYNAAAIEHFGEFALLNQV